MKKLSCITCIILCLSLIGCGASTSTSPASSTASSSTSSVSSAAAGGAVKIGFVTNLSVGGATEQGTCSRQGFELAIEEINASGGINGVMLEPVIYDDEAAPEKAVENVTRLINQDEVVAILGFVNSGNAQASMQLCQEAEIPLFVNYATATAITTTYQQEEKNYIFRYSLLDTEQVSKMLDFVQSKGFQKIGILHDTSGYGVNGMQDIVAQMDSRGMKYEMIETLNTNDTDMTPQLTKFKNADIDCVILYNLSPENANTIRSANKIDYHPTFIGSWSISFTTFTRLAGESQNGVNMTTAYRVGQTPKSTELHEALIAKYGSDVLPVASAFAYDSMMMLAQAMKNSPSLDSKNIRDALEATEIFDGAVGVIENPFTKEDHEAISGEYIYTAVWENNEIVPAK